MNTSIGDEIVAVPEERDTTYRNRGYGNNGNNNEDDTAPTAGPTESAACQNGGTAGIPETIFLMVNATLGAGLLNFPQAFDKAGGISCATSVQLVLLIFITSALVVLAHCSDLAMASNMQDTLANLCGERALFVCGICVALYSFGCCVTFVIVIGDQFDRVLATYYGMDFCNVWYLSRAFVTSVACCLFVLPFCFFKSLRVLGCASFIGCITIVYLIWIVMAESSGGGGGGGGGTTTGRGASFADTSRGWAAGALEIIPIVCFAYQSHMTAIPTYACMRERNIVNFTVCSFLSTTMCFIAYTLVGIFGYTRFAAIGSAVPDDILQGFTETSGSLTIAIIAVAVKNFVTYPIVLFCGRDALLGLCGTAGGSASTTRVARSIVGHVAVTAGWFGSSLLIAVLIPDIGSVIDLMGSLSAAFIFVFPGICLLRCALLDGETADHPRMSGRDRFFLLASILMIVLGAFISGFVFAKSLREILSRDNHVARTGLNHLRKSLCRGHR